MTETVIGDFDQIPAYIPAEGDIFIRVKPIDLISYWKRCGILANFSAAFYAFTKENPKIQENAISTVVNELIENATKFSVKREAEVLVQMKLYDTVLKIQIENLTTKHHFLKLQRQLKRLQSNHDLENLYFETLVAKSESPEDSGIGLLLIRKDYQIRLGAKFIESDGKYRVQIQALYVFDNVRN
jgi:hypothetical protein